jgi:tetraprenyl-beta-curcumene synthase
MGTATHRGPRAHVAPRAQRAPLAPARSVPRLPEQLALPRAFAATVFTYLLRVMPSVRRELAGWDALAAQIPNPTLRRQATLALGKRGNIEGAALFATLAPAARRRETVRALVAFQTAYNYLDALSELPSEDPVANGDQLHQALLVALYRGAPHPDYYAHNHDRGDGGYLTAIVDTCRDALAALPSYPVLAPTVRAAAAQIVDFQALNLSGPQGGHEALRRWATDLTPPGSDLAWWEIAAAGGSSLAVHALIASAATAHLDRSHAGALERAYFPWTGALHTLLDSLVGRSCMLDYYDSPADAAMRLASLARDARGATERLPSTHAHGAILTAMCSYYLSAPQCYTAEARTITRALTRALGLPLNVAILMFRCRRSLHTLTHHAYI